jgi:hypothetical protein
MRTLTLIVTDLYLSREVRAALGEPIDRYPSLPALELLLARASERRESEWRALACEIAGVPVAERIPVAALTRLSENREASAPSASDQWWLASAVHLTAALDHVQLSEVLRLVPDEWQEIESGFNREFGDDVGTLETSMGAEAFWRPPRALDARTVDPARVVGGDVHDALPEGADGGRLRQLMTEVQMWLYQHPLNGARERAGVPAANGLWFWGGGALPAWHSSIELPRLITGDGFMRGLWALLGGQKEPLPAQLPGLRPASPRGLVVAIGLHELPGVSWLERLRVLEGAWLAPGLSGLRSGTVERLHLQINDALFVVRRGDARRFWRRARPWIEVIA